MNKEEHDMPIAHESETGIPFTPRTYVPNADLEHLLDISEAVRFIQKQLQYATAEAPGYDPAIIRQIRAEGEVVDAYLARVLLARRVIDRNIQKTVAGELKEQLASLQAASDRLKSIAGNNEKPEWVNVYLEMALKAIADVDTLVKEQS